MAEWDSAFPNRNFYEAVVARPVDSVRSHTRNENTLKPDRLPHDPRISRRQAVLAGNFIRHSQRFVDRLRINRTIHVV